MRVSRPCGTIANSGHDYPMQAPPVRRVSFGVFEMDLETGELRKHGLRIRLQPQPFDVLAMLVERAGHVVTREELQQKLWPANTFVDFDHGLNKAINKIREALGDSAETPRFVETVARRGYRFLADVRMTVPAAAAIPPLPADSPIPSAPTVTTALDRAIEAPAPSLLRSRHAWTWVLAASVVLMLASAGLVWRLRSVVRAQPTIHSLAVLPLESLSSDPAQDYF